ncbi:uncharacterized protein DUF3159 [Pseudonocardia sediminis]|uniref:Uncharacterized protein DUF3159 n=1 Tax=Pseudonocardia sediminis TaxID=1397368 RepID=A0A4Q7UU96_PSEST|nr:DUF3159 domain-containing protein [Pseudonocardia sediminis]RZT85432.1 uncharacterized protein DUF3159 [Pseudonocardia sediminis]
MSEPHPDSTPTTRLPRIDADTPPPDGRPRAGARPGEPVSAPAEVTGPTESIAAQPGAGTTGETPGRTATGPTLMDQMGGISGIVASTVPVAVFVVVNVITSLRPALYAAIAAGVVVLIWRLVRRDPIQPAISGLIGVGICALVANQTGEARGFYLPGLLYSGFLALVALVSVIVRWPLAGVIWHGINGHGQEWRSDRRLLKAYTWATGIWALVFGLRVVVQGLLYDANAENALGIARLAMGYPLFGVAILATILIVRRAERAGTPTAT